MTSGLQNLTFAKDQLLAIIRENRDSHRQVFLEAVEGYRQIELTDLETRIKELTSGHLPRIRFVGRELPQDHTDDYDNVIEMLERSTDTEITLNRQEFSQYVRDQWTWMAQFANVAAGYGSTTARQNARFASYLTDEGYTATL